MDGQRCHPRAPGRGAERVLLDGTETSQQPQRERHRGRGRPLEPPEERRVAGRPEKDVEEGRGEVGPEELGLFEGAQALLLVPGEEAKREARAEAAGAAGALLGARARNAAEDQPVEAGARVEAEGAREARVDDRGDALDRERRFGDVRREDDAAVAGRRGCERGVLGGAGKVAVEDADVEGLVHRLHGLARPADLEGAREEDEDVSSRALRQGGPHGRRDAGLEGPRVGLVRVPDLDGEGAPGDAHDRRRAARVREERGDGIRIERGGGDEKQEVLAEGRADLAEHREGEVRVAAPLVELVEHHARDAREGGVLEEAASQDPLGHDEDARPGRADGFVADLVPGALSDRLPQLRGDPARRGAGGDPSRLQHPERAGSEESRRKERRRHPRRLAGARRGDEDERPAIRESDSTISGRNGSMGSAGGTGRRG